MRRAVRSPTVGLWVLALSVGLLHSAAMPAWADASLTYGGVLRVAIAADPSSLDCHQERTLAISI